MTGTFISVGVGPGDPQLLTLAAVDTIERCRVVALPASGAGDNAAARIAGALLEGKELLYCPAPMSRDRGQLQAVFAQNADLLAGYLDRGENVAFLTLGDPTVYATPMYLHRILKERGYPTRIVPGVPSFCAAAAALDMPLCEGGEMLHVIPASYPDSQLALDYPGTKELMKSGRSLQQIKKQLAARPQLRARAVERCGMPGQVLYEDLKQIDESASYFTVVIAKEESQ